MAILVDQNIRLQIHGGLYLMLKKARMKHERTHTLQVPVYYAVQVEVVKTLRHVLQL